ncbi:MAG: TOBE-like domain-containing protein [Puniceicoccales bacterium]|jgi:sulfate transport system ATP-binding protein|nr:TOBE-like domain-containing protein [Puniceicoccales bacterium]
MSIHARNITKTFGDYTALNNVSLNVADRQLVALLGPSGSGKTTLLRIIAGLEFADAGSGHVFFDEEDVTDVPPARRNVGFVFQHYALFKHLTVAENIAFGLNVRRAAERPSKSEIAERVQTLLKLIQLDDLGARLPSQLSGGQRQRVALARALATRPKVLLLDEPFGALDAKVRRDLRRWLRNFHHEIQVTTIFVTHDQEEALEIADEVVIMNNAVVEQVGEPQEVYDRPATAFVNKFLGNVNQIALPWSGLLSNQTAGGKPRFHIENNNVFVRPHDIDIVRFDTGRDGSPAVVENIHAAGPVGRVAARREDGLGVIDIEISRATLDLLRLREGDRVLLRTRTRPAETAVETATNYAI